MNNMSRVWKVGAVGLFTLMGLAACVAAGYDGYGGGGYIGGVYEPGGYEYAEPELSERDHLVNGELTDPPKLAD